jgi:hypothetical protein
LWARYCGGRDERDKSGTLHRLDAADPSPAGGLCGGTGVLLKLFFLSSEKVSITFHIRRITYTSEEPGSKSGTTKRDEYCGRSGSATHGNRA